MNPKFVIFRSFTLIQTRCPFQNILEMFVYTQSKSYYVFHNCNWISMTKTMNKWIDQCLGEKNNVQKSCEHEHDVEENHSAKSSADPNLAKNHHAGALVGPKVLHAVIFTMDKTLRATGLTAPVTCLAPPWEPADVVVAHLLQLSPPSRLARSPPVQPAQRLLTGALQSDFYCCYYCFHHRLQNAILLWGSLRIGNLNSNSHCCSPGNCENQKTFFRWPNDAWKKGAENRGERVAVDAVSTV